MRSSILLLACCTLTVAAIGLDVESIKAAAEEHKSKLADAAKEHGGKLADAAKEQAAKAKEAADAKLAEFGDKAKEKSAELATKAKAKAGEVARKAAEEAARRAKELREQAEKQVAEQTQKMMAASLSFLQLSPEMVDALTGVVKNLGMMLTMVLGWIYLPTELFLFVAVTTLISGPWIIVLFFGLVKSSILMGMESPDKFILLLIGIAGAVYFRSNIAAFFGWVMTIGPLNDVRLAYLAAMDRAKFYLTHPVELYKALAALCAKPTEEATAFEKLPAEPAVAAADVEMGAAPLPDTAPMELRLKSLEEKLDESLKLLAALSAPSATGGPAASAASKAKSGFAAMLSTGKKGAMDA